jgi:uncharacterized membrane protein
MENNLGQTYTGAQQEEPYAGPLQNVSNFERGLSIGIGALMIYSSVRNFRKTPVRALLRAAIGSGLIFRGSSGNCPVYHELHIDGTRTSSINIRTTFTVNKPRNEVYSAWRNLGTLPRFMKHLKNVSETSGTRSHWEAKIPEGSPVSISWDADIVKDEPGTLLSWRSLPGSTVENAGKVEFRDALGHQGTEIRVMISYRPPAGNIGAGVAKLLNPLFRKIVKDDVMNFKEYIEFQHAGAVDGFR